MTIVCIQSHLHNLHLHRHDLSCLPVCLQQRYIYHARPDSWVETGA